MPKSDAIFCGRKKIFAQNQGDAVKQELFDIIKDPVYYKHKNADQQIRAELVKIKDAIDNIDQMVFDLRDAAGTTDTSLRSMIQGKTSDIENVTIEIADDLDAEMEKIDRD